MFQAIQAWVISIHALREESDLFSDDMQDTFKKISIHALREESDSTAHRLQYVWIWFQSTLSVRRATFSFIEDTPFPYNISIHALREESDITTSAKTLISKNFNPRSPWGERP